MHEEIINLIESPELREHLLHNPQLLSGDHYTQIIGGASIEINRKREMLVAAERGSSDETFSWYGPEICINYIDGCLNALKAVDGNRKVLLISEISFVNSKVGSAITHGPFPVASWQAALAAMKAYADKWSEMTDLSSSYWMTRAVHIHTTAFYSQTTLTTQTPAAKSSTSAGKKRANVARCSTALWWDLWPVVQGGICRPAHAVQKGRHS